MECLQTKRDVNEYRETYVGWRLKGKLVHPLCAYRDTNDWFSDFEAIFPKKAKKMKEYSERNGWAKQAHRYHWSKAVISWLNQNA